MRNRLTYVVFPERLITEIDDFVGKRSRSRFVVAAATYELKRQRQLAALQAATGAWKLADHPELKGGALAYERKLRLESDRRLEKPTARSPRR